MTTITKLKKKRKRKILSVSASSISTGLQCLYVETSELDWNILGFETFSYSKDIITILKDIANDNISIKRLAIADNIITEFISKSISEFLSQKQKNEQIPDLIAIKNYSIFSNKINENKIWNITIGSSHSLSKNIKTPVLSDFSKIDINAGFDGSVRINSGIIKIAQKAGNVVGFVNIGLTASLTIIESWRPLIIADVNTGPGTFLINELLSNLGNEEGFDRDGVKATNGKVHTDILTNLANHNLFKSENKIDLEDYKVLLDDKHLKKLSFSDQIATITALTAKTISDNYKKYHTPKDKTETIWLSGGGANNLALKEYLDAYFSPIPVKNIEELGIPTDGKFLLSLALTVNDWLNNKNIWPTDYSNPKLEFGNWYFSFSK